jgi:hypothetical protein
MADVSDSQLNAMNQVLFQMRGMKPNVQNPVFTIDEIVEEWHTVVDDTTSVETIDAILQQGASTGLFLFAQDITGLLSYGFNLNMLASNPRNKDILLTAPLSARACLEPCNQRNKHCCAFVPAVRSDCCFTQWKGTVAGGSLSTQCGASMATTMFLCSGQQTLFCGPKETHVVRPARTQVGKHVPSVISRDCTAR